jgi:hypothetical protein
MNTFASIFEDAIPNIFQQLVACHWFKVFIGGSRPGSGRDASHKENLDFLQQSF